jgi:hypothetical protein
MIRRAALGWLVLALACEDPAGNAADAATESADSQPPTSSTGSGGTDDPSTSGEDGDEVSGSSTGEGSGDCGSGFRCVDPAPAGWLGPVARYRGTDSEEPPSCGGGYPDGGITLFEGFKEPGPAECDCSCAVNLSNACSITVYVDLASSTCSDFSNFVMMAGDCTTYDVPSGSVYGTIFSNGGAVGCSPDAPVVVPEVEWDAQVFTCGGATPGDACGSGDGVCTARAPDGYEPELCVFTQGENDCPTEGAYTERALLFSAVDDDRDCTTCECGNPPPITCNGTFDVYDSDDSGTMLASTAPNTCSGPIAGGSSIYVDTPDDPDCGVAVAPEPQGTATPSGRFTFCCQSD